MRWLARAPCCRRSPRAAGRGHAAGSRVRRRVAAAKPARGVHRVLPGIGAGRAACARGGRGPPGRGGDGGSRRGGGRAPAAGGAAFAGRPGGGAPAGTPRRPGPLPRPRPLARVRRFARGAAGRRHGGAAPDVRVLLADGLRRASGGLPAQTAAAAAGHEPGLDGGGFHRPGAGAAVGGAREEPAGRDRQPGRRGRPAGDSLPPGDVHGTVHREGLFRRRDRCLTTAIASVEEVMPRPAAPQLRRCWGLT